MQNSRAIDVNIFVAIRFLEWVLRLSVVVCLCFCGETLAVHCINSDVLMCRNNDCSRISSQN